MTEPTLRDTVYARLDAHNKSRVTLQSRLEEICGKLIREVDELEERLENELDRVFEKEDTAQQETIQKTLAYTSADSPESNTSLKGYKLSYCIVEEDDASEISERFSLKFFRKEVSVPCNDAFERLRAQAEENHKHKVDTSKELNVKCTNLRKEVETLKEKVNEGLGVLFVAEDARLQALLSEKDEVRARAGLIVKQNYVLTEEPEAVCLQDKYVLTSVKSIWGLEDRLFDDFRVASINGGKVFLEMKPIFDPEEWVVLARFGFEESIVTKVRLLEAGESGGTEQEEGASYDVDDDSSFFPSTLIPRKTYKCVVRAECKEQRSKWSNEIKFVTPAFFRVLRVERVSGMC